MDSITPIQLRTYKGGIGKAEKPWFRGLNRVKYLGFWATRSFFRDAASPVTFFWFRGTFPGFLTEHWLFVTVQKFHPSTVRKFPSDANYVCDGVSMLLDVIHANAEGDPLRP